jgi:hypothetical protein
VKKTIGEKALLVNIGLDGEREYSSNLIESQLKITVSK